MRIRFVRQTMWALVTLLVVSLCFVDTSAQRSRRKRSRRITNPVRTSTQPVAQPTPLPQPNSDVRIISTADDPLLDDTQGEVQPPATTRRTNRSRNAAASDPEQDSTQRTVNRLSRQVDRLTDKISQIEGQQRALVDLERLSRAEQRAEGFRSQLRDVQSKEADLQGRLEQIEYDLKPENIERTAAFYGTTRPEDVRDARRRQLENEKTRIQSQLTLLQTSRTRLEAAIALADTEVERLRARLDASDPVTTPPVIVDDNGTQRTTSSDTTTTPNSPAPEPSPTGTP